MQSPLFTSHDRRPLVMGVVNVTPDSFYAGSRVADESAGLGRALEMARSGADILDVGGESTRPGSAPVDAAEERARVVPVIEAIRRSIDTHISVDTRKAEVAEAGLDAGATMVNDVSGLRDDPALLRLVANRKVPVCIMHMQGSPQTMQRNPEYADPVLDIREELRRRVEAALEGGVAPEQIIVDPGIGFGKTVRDNIALIARLSELRELGYPILVGLSRKSFIGRVLAYGGGPDGAPTTEQAPQKPEPQREPERTGASRFEAIDRVDPRPVEERLAGTLGATALAIHGGADILRVHDVAETADLVTVMGAISHLSTEAGSSR